MPLDLNLTVSEARDARGVPDLLLAHGLLGQSRNFMTLARGFSESRRVLIPDMRNHGASPWDERMDYPSMAEDLRGVVETQADGRCDILGHSMGGKAAMRLALEYPENVERLIVADIAPVSYTHTHGPLLDTMRALDLSSLGTRTEADKALRAAVPEPAMRAFVLQNLEVGRGVPARWKPNVDVLLAQMEKLVGWDAPDDPAPFTSPTLFLSGGTSDYVTPEHRGAILDLFPNAVFEVIEGAGHWLHAEKPNEFRAAVEAFLD